MKETGASSEYQELIQVLSALLLTLQHLQRLDSKCADPNLINAIRSLIAEAEKPILEFVQDIQRFDSALGRSTITGKLKGGIRRAEWALAVSKKVEKLHRMIASWMQPIHLLLQGQNL